MVEPNDADLAKNPAYRPATETPAHAGVSSSPRMVCQRYGAMFWFSLKTLVGS
jgi:hypothetical protein